MEVACFMQTPCLDRNGKNPLELRLRSVVKTTLTGHVGICRGSLFAKRVDD